MLSFLVGAVTGCIMTLGFGGEIGGHSHAGVDLFCGYFSPVYSPYSGKVLYRDDETGAVALLIGTSTPSLFLIGHMATTAVAVGSEVRVGDFLGREGFRGEVYYHGRREDSPLASHRHYGIYPLVEDTDIRSGEFYIYIHETWYRNEKGNYLRIQEPNNGHAGACDPEECLRSDYESV